MATFTITHVTRVDDYAIVQTLEGTDIGVGQSIQVAGLAQTGLNGNHTVLDIPTHRYLGVDDEGDWIFDPVEIITNQLLFADAGDDIERRPTREQLPGHKLAPGSSQLTFSRG